MNLKRESTGEILSLDTSLQLGGGGEGIICPLPNNADLVAKIYHPGVMDEPRERKLNVMLADPPEDPMREKGHASIAWPIDLLRSCDGGQAVVGYLMPRLKHVRPISDFYDVTTRHKLFPLLSYKYLCRAARNLASAVSAVHQRGTVVGDVNESNILADAKALVTLVDTDSFQVTDWTSGQIYRCPVGTDMFTPREIQGRNFEEIDRLPAHDLFGIAVLFFQLLMEGTRPFSGVYRGSGEPPDQVERLIKGYFPFADHPMVSPPPQAPLFQMLHPRLQELFRRCFVEGHNNPERRPDAQTWYEALKESELSLRSCHNNPQHFYFDHNRNCPWCERASLYATVLRDWDPFPAPEKAQEFTHYDYAAGRSAAHTWQPVSLGATLGMTPGPVAAPRTSPPPLSFFTSSVATVSVGQPVTLQWSIPNAHNIRITNAKGRRVFVGQTPSGTFTVYPIKNQTYHIGVAGTMTTALSPVSVSVQTPPQPVPLKDTMLDLRRPNPLSHQQLGLRAALPLREFVVKLLRPSKLKYYLPLHAHRALKQVSIGLKQGAPFIEAI